MHQRGVLRVAVSEHGLRIGKFDSFAQCIFVSLTAALSALSPASARDYQHLAPQSLPAQSNGAVALPPAPAVQIDRAKDLAVILKRLNGLRLVNYPNKIRPN